MKGPSVTLPVRRLVAALALGAALVTSGCGTTEANRAAVVDGNVIPETEVQEAMTQVNAMEPALFSQPWTPTATLTALVRAPVVLDYLAGKGFVASESKARQTARDRGIKDPGPGTIEIIRFATALTDANQSGRFGDAEGQELSAQLRAQDVVVNPRYGSFDPETADIAVTLPPWVTPYNASK